MVSDPNLFDNNLASFPEETTGFEGDTSLLDSLDTNEPEAAELPDATPLDPRMTQYELEPPGSQGTDPFDASATGLPAERSAEPDPRFGAGTCSHCGGRGYTTYPSSGRQERCWYCNGSGVSS
jgi:hypothetical protein